jgi:hypothetical protein
LDGYPVYEDFGCMFKKKLIDERGFAQWGEFRHRIIKKTRRLKAITATIKTATVGSFQPKAIANKKK